MTEYPDIFRMSELIEMTGCRLFDLECALEQDLKRVKAALKKKYED